MSGRLVVLPVGDGRWLVRPKALALVADAPVPPRAPSDYAGARAFALAVNRRELAGRIARFGPLAGRGWRR